MKKGTKLALGALVAAAGVILLSSCTQSFCSVVDQGRMLYAFDPGVTRYKSGGSETYTYTNSNGKTYTISGFSYEYATWESDTNRFVLTESEDDSITYLTHLNKIISSSISNGYLTVNGDSIEYYKAVDKEVLDLVMDEALKDDSLTDGSGNINLDLSNKNPGAGFATFQRQLSYFSYVKYVSGDDAGLWENYEKIDNKVRDTLSEDICPSTDFKSLYKSNMNSYIAAYRTCLTTKTDKYGTYGYSADGVFIEQKSWSFAWNKGLFEGLLVYPIGWLIDQISFGFQNAGVASGWAALLAILFVTLIVRSIMLLATIKQTTSNARMTELQPEIQKIQNKYPNSNTSQTEKQRMAEEMNRLYKKNKINPFTTIIVMIVQFPVFICVWGALSGNAAISSGTVFGLDLSLGIRQVLFEASNWSAAGNYSAITALVLFLLMAGSQTISMLLPQWIQKAKAKKAAKLGVNPAAKANENRMKWFTYIMLAMIIFMGFSLVSAMGVYWFIGALFSLVQTLITQVLIGKASKKKNY